MKSPVCLHLRTIFKDSLIKSLLLGIFLIFSVNSVLKAQDFWEEIVLPDTIVPIRVDFDSIGNIYLLSLDNIYRSSDNGDTWDCLNVSQYDSGNKDIEILDDSNIYFGVDPFNNFYVSNNHGLSWDTIPTDIQGMIVLRMINNGEQLLAGTYRGIYKSTDYGSSWEHVLALSGVEMITDILFADSILFAGSINFMNPESGGIYHSLDQGQFWQRISLEGYGVSSLALDIDNNLLCGVRFQYYALEYGILRSFDSGYSWNNILSGHLVTSIVLDVNGNIYAGCDSDFGPGGVKVSNDNGISWSSLNSGFIEEVSIKSLAISPAGFLFALTTFPMSLYRSAEPLVLLEEPEFDKGSNFQIFPNPCKNVIYVSMTKNSSYKASEIFQLRVLNPYGEVLSSEHYDAYDGSIIPYDVSFLKPGVYFLMLSRNRKVQILPLIKV